MTARPLHEPVLPLTTHLRGPKVLLVVVTLLTTLFALSWWRYTTERDAIAGLPDVERRAFYERTLQTLRTTCSTGTSGLAEHCAEQADRIVQFPECDEPCRKLAQSYSKRPTR